jgi:DNA repair protein RecN (Recombination protein N)
VLAALTVKDIVLIESAALEFAPGLNVLTGETGAGKSILLDSLGLAGGGRSGGRAGVRPGAQQGSATAVFDPARDHRARAYLLDNAIVTGGEIILRRTIAADGRTRAFINDEPVGVATLARAGEMLVEVHGQSDDRGLFDIATHRRLLDAFGGHEKVAAETAERFAALAIAREARDALKHAATSAAADADYLRHGVDELSALEPEAGEEARLGGERALMMNAGRIAEEVSAAVEALSGERGAEAGLASALKRLSRMNEEARKAAAAAEAALDQAFAQTEEARRELESLLARLEADPARLEKTEDRLHALRAAARKYAVSSDGLSGVLTEFQTKLDTIDNSGALLKDAEAAVTRAQSDYLASARTLSAARKEAARKLESAVAKELTPLKLGHAKFRVALDPLAEADAGANGVERVAFEAATIEGAAFGAMTKIASGGELARFSLALKVALAEASPPAALVFDEVDRGVGGSVADAVGERLQRLAKDTQVLLVTHSPQVAARAERHFRITRSGDRTKVEVLDEDARIEELARMLSGAAVTAEARAAAKRLLAEARAITQPAPKKQARKRA